MKFISVEAIAHSIDHEHYKAYINPECIMGFEEAKPDQAKVGGGTMIVLQTGAAYLVTDNIEDVLNKIEMALIKS